MTNARDDDSSSDSGAARGERERRADDISQRPPPQFGLRGLLLLTAAVALLFGTMRWIGVSPEASALVLLVLMISALGAIALLLTILRE